MSDFDARLTEVLTSESESAPDVLGLADAARGRARTRRRTKLVGLSAAAVLAVAVPTVAVLATGGSGGGDRQGVDTPVLDGPADGLRLETWRNVTVEVPEEWGYGSVNQWCTADVTTPSPVVEKPGIVTTLMLCEPGFGYGVTFADLRQGGVGGDIPVSQPTDDLGYPSGAWVGWRAIGEVGVTVSAADRATAEQVLASATLVEDEDPNGCAVDPNTPVESGGRMEVCRYDAEGFLTQSELLSADDTAAAEAALAQVGTQDSSSCEGRGGVVPAPYVVMAARGSTYRVVFEADDCSALGVFVGKETFGPLSEDVLYWAISPGWAGGISGDVALPATLRTYDPAG